MGETSWTDEMPCQGPAFSTGCNAVPTLLIRLLQCKYLKSNFKISLTIDHMHWPESYLQRPTTLTHWRRADDCIIMGEGGALIISKNRFLNCYKGHKGIIPIKRIRGSKKGGLKV